MDRIIGTGPLLLHNLWTFGANLQNTKHVGKHTQQSSFLMLCLMGGKLKHFLQVGVSYLLTKDPSMADWFL